LKANIQLLRDAIVLFTATCTARGKGKGKATEVKGAAGFLEIEDVLTKLISALLTRINRALRFAKLNAQDTK
jgi:hypothetical protein